MPNAVDVVSMEFELPFVLFVVIVAPEHDGMSDTRVIETNRVTYLMRCYPQ